MQAFIIVAASIFLALGTLHSLLTLRDLKNPRAFTPRDPALLEAMRKSSIRLHPSINLWDAWIGFNFSHSLGIMLFGGAFLYIGLFEPRTFATSNLLQACAVIVSAIYLLLSLKFWFSKPAIGSAISLICFLAATGIAHA